MAKIEHATALSQRLRCTPALPADRMAEVRRRAIFECCKWDPQAGDTTVLADFAVTVAPEQWRGLAAIAEALYVETLAAEQEILERGGNLLARLALPRRLARVLQRPDARASAASTGRAFRVMRFDFHPAREGWRVTEVNSDVPGGYVEASGVAELMREELARTNGGCDFALPGNPAEKLAAFLRERLPEGKRVTLVHATAYTDDRQVMMFLRRFFEKSGFAVSLASPAQIVWRDGAAFAPDDAADSGRLEKVDALFRFFPAEWLSNLDGHGWKNFFSPEKFPHTLLINPGCAVVSQTKCFPLAWDAFAKGAPRVWTDLMPETRPLDGARRGRIARLFKPARLPDAADWVVKPALGRVGDGIGFSGVTRDKDMVEILRSCRRHPRHWVAQRKFASTPLDTPHGRGHACIGVYVINGYASGIYGRIAPQPLINHLAQDVAVLVAPETRNDGMIFL